MAEKIILTGNEEELKPIITQLFAIHQMLEYRDIGQFLGYPVDEYVRARPQPLKVVIVFFSVPTPPWKKLKKKDRFVRATYAIPNIDKRKLTWENIKKACGGANGYQWGRFRCTLHLDNGRQMQVHGGSEKEAEDRAMALAALSTAKIIAKTNAEEKREGRRASDKKLYKDTTRIYPGYFSILNQEKIITQTNTATLDGNFLRDKAKINLWVTKKPSDCDAIIKETLRVKGANNQTE